MNAVVIRKVRVADIVAMASRMTGLAEDVIIGRDRARHVVRVRQAVYLIARRNGHSYPQIGVHTGGKDHSSVIHGVDVATNAAAKLPLYAAFVDDLDRLAATTKPFAQIPGHETVALPIPACKRKPKKPKNDFAAKPKEQDKAHSFHAGIAHGTANLLAAINAARKA